MWQKVKPRVIRLRVMEGSHARDQIALCAFHTLLVEVQTNCWLRRIRNKNLEITIAGSSCRPQY